MKELESAVERYLVNRAEGLGGVCVKFLPDYRRGWPDRILLLPGGTLVWIETKRPQGGRVSPMQRVAHFTLRRLGQRVELVCTKEDADALLYELTVSQGDAQAGTHTGTHTGTHAGE